MKRAYIKPKLKLFARLSAGCLNLYRAGKIIAAIAAIGIKIPKTIA